MAISNEIIQFANGNTDFYEAFADYYNHKAAEEWNSKMGAYDHNVSLSVKSGKVRDAFFGIICHCEAHPLLFYFFKFYLFFYIHVYVNIFPK